MTTPVESSDFTFPAADIGGELNPEASREFQVDPVSSEIAASKEQAEAEVEAKAEAEAEAKKESEEKDVMHTLKSALIIAGIVAAVAGAAFVITKKLKEK